MQINSVGTTSFRSRTNDHKYGYIGYNVTPYNLIGVKPKNNDKTTCDETIFKKTPKQKVPRRSNLDGCHWHMHGSNDLENWRAGSRGSQSCLWHMHGSNDLENWRAGSN